MKDTHMLRPDPTDADSAMSIQKPYFGNLDSLRFFAASMVFLQHAIMPLFAEVRKKDPILDRIIGVVCDGGTGVSIFFVLSGFLITYLLISEYEQKQAVDIKKFYVRRMLRIWPLYYAVILFSFFIYPFLKAIVHLNAPLASNVLYHLAFLSNFDVINIMKYHAGQDAMSQNITWSVSIEEQFYLLWPLIFVILPRRIWLYAVIVVICFSVWFRFQHHDDINVLYFHTFSVLVDLAIGGLFAISIKFNHKIRSFFESVDTLWHFCFFSVIILLLFSADLFYSMPNGRAIYRVFTAISFAFVIASQALTTRNSRCNFANFAFATKYGKYTYGIYLLHPIVLTLLSVSVRVLRLNTDNLYISLCIGIIAFIITLLVSKLSYYSFERVFLKMKERSFAA